MSNDSMSYEHLAALYAFLEAQAAIKEWIDRNIGPIPKELQDQLNETEAELLAVRDADKEQNKNGQAG